MTIYFEAMFGLSATKAFETVWTKEKWDAIMVSQPHLRTRLASFFPLKVFSKIFFFFFFLFSLSYDVGGQFLKSISANPSEALFLLTSLATIASSRPPRIEILSESALPAPLRRLDLERRIGLELVMMIAAELFEISFLNLDTRDEFSKLGRDLLTDICTAHPLVISSLFEIAYRNLASLGRMALYLFQSSCNLFFCYFTSLAKCVYFLQASPYQNGPPAIMILTCWCIYFVIFPTSTRLAFLSWSPSE